MDAIEFVVRGADGSIRRGMFEDINGQAAINVGNGDNVSINIRRYQAIAYSREGEVLVIELADGRTLRLRGFFEGENDLFLSADGALTEVALSEHAGGVDAVYQDAQAFGKWNPDDALFFTGGPDVDTIIAADGAVNETPTMLAAPILAGLGGLGGAPLAAAALGGVGVIAAGGGGGGSGAPTDEDRPADEPPADEPPADDPDANPLADTTAPVVAITQGTVEVGHLFNEPDHSDGVELGGTSEPGATIVVAVGGETVETVTASDGTWSVVFDPADVGGGEYTTDVTVTATDPAGNSTVITEEIQVDTVTTVTLAEIDGTAANSGATINAVGHADGVTMSGTGEVGASITVAVAGGPTTTTTVDANGDWSIDFPAADVATGEYSSGVTITAIDAAGNTATTTGTMIVDTLTTVAITGNSAGPDGIVNAVENQSATALNGTSQANSTVVITVTHENGTALGTQSTVSDGNGQWQVSFPSGTFPSGEYDVTVSAVATDSHGNSQSATTTLPVDTITSVDLTHIDGDPVNSGAVINATEHADGVTMTGTGEPNGAITVTVPGGGTATTTVNASGQWSVNFAPGDIPQGETSVPVTVSIVGDAGNTATSTQTMVIDTVTSVQITGNNAGTENIYNNVEVGRTVTINGTAQANASVEVTLTNAAGNFLGTTTTIANGAGNWVADFPANSLPGGEYSVNVAAQATDQAGNTATDTSSFEVDTVARIDVNDGGQNDGAVINIVEAADGVILTGTTEPNASVNVNFAGATQSVFADGAGNWSAGFAATSIPLGVETTLPITATFTDRAGNSASASGSVGVDTIVRNLGVAPATGDSVIDAAEASTGFTLAGTTEQGAKSVAVTFGNGAARNAAIDAAGNWSITFGPNDIPQGEYDTTITVTTVDKNDNTDIVTSPVKVDTALPETPVVISYTEYTRGDPGVSGIGTELNDDITSISKISETGQVSGVSYSANTLPEIPGVRDGEMQFNFNERIPDGSHLIVQAEDGVGNESSTLVVLDESGTDVVDATASGLDQFDIGAIDLSIAEDSVLTLTEADLLAMSGVSDTLIVHGDANDVVHATGLVATGATETIGNQTYDVYTLGAGSLIIDSDISVNPVI
ncbi:MAG: Ig-like domain-containing protein [Pseudomonadota bacterium]